MPTSRLNGIDIHWERRGPTTGPRVLFLNGSGSSLESSAPVVDTLAAHLDLLAHDQRGLGRTAVPPGPYTMQDYAADAVALLDHVGWDTCSVVGISFGGMVAQELAVTVPERLHRLVLWCTSPGGVGGASAPLQQRSATLLDTRFSDEWLADHPTDRALAAASARRAQRERTPDEARGEAEQLGARDGHDVCDRLHRITCPTLVGAGRFDGIAPVANAEAIVERIPGAALRVYEGGHLFFAQDARAFPDLFTFLDPDRGEDAPTEHGVPS